MEKRLWTKDFTLVVIGQIISLFGNAAIRFVLPLYLLNQTGSSALYGTVTACAFVPAIVLSPVGGIVADRVNKRNIMVILDFSTAGLIAAFSLSEGSGNLVVMITVTLMLLYGIAGAYQPSVQASIPALVSQENILAANSVVNIVNSFSALLGPVLGGILYSLWTEACAVHVRGLFFLICRDGAFYQDTFCRTEDGRQYVENGEGGFCGKHPVYPEGRTCYRESSVCGLRDKHVSVRYAGGGDTVYRDGGAAV